MNHAKFVAVVIVSVFIPSISYAEVFITEIMYDLEGTDTSREWIEVRNTGSSAITLTEWKLFEADTNHSINSYGGGESVAGGSYAIIADNPAKFLEDWPNFSGALFDSAFSLANTGEMLMLRCCGNDLQDKDSASYTSQMGAVGGKSLQRVSQGGSFTVGTATPGSGTVQTGLQNTNQTGTEETATQTSGSGGGGNSSSVSLARVSLGDDRTVIVGSEIQFEGTAQDSSKRAVEAQFRWNFGDGTGALGQSVRHRFEYPGRYAVVLEASRYGEILSDRIIVTVDSPNLSLQPLPDGGIVIENLSNRDLDLSNWQIIDGNFSFTFVPNTIVLRNASIRFSASTLRFHVSGKTRLLYPNGTVALEVSPPPEAQVPISAAAPSEATTSPQKKVEEVAAPVLEIYAAAEDPVAFASIEEDARKEEVSEGTQTENIEQVGAVGATIETPSNRSFLWWIGIVTLFGLAAVAIFAVRRSRRKGWTIIEDMSE